MAMTAAATVVFMIGDPVAQTVMPGVVNAEAQAGGLDLGMVPLHVPPAGLAGFVSALRDWGNVRGFVATAPHKQALMNLVDRVEGAAAACGAVNIVFRGADGALVGDNIDGVGFVGALRLNGFDPRGARVMQFGCGGAGASIAYALAQAGATDLALADPEAGRIAALQDRLGGVCRVAGPNDLAMADLIVNATAIGLDGVSMVDPLDATKSGALIADIVTKPPVTPFLQRARGLGLRIQTGAQMAEAQVKMALERFALE
ncbi:shikimate dehydrogenase family protein [Chachezhania sediminis]|uniref:shikimate dehydrogenase family protein n=1 Tax=Chachezhania sediminis TaxID=2599291 RepID=UPI00131B0C41|nr:shikimate dehydrogenase [Chachezhania sediminis]